MKPIRTLLIFAALLLTVSGLQGQSADLRRLLDELEGQDGVTSVLVSQKMFQLFTKTTDLDIDGQSLNEVIGNLEELKIIEVGDWEKAAKDLKDRVHAILKRDQFETLMKVVEDGETVEISVLSTGDVIRHLVMFIRDSDDRSIQIISIVGKIDLEQISKLSGTLNIEGLEHLDKE